MASTTGPSAAARRGRGAGRRLLILPALWPAGVMIAPFLILSFVFMVLPTLMLASNAVSGADGLTLRYIAALGGETFRHAAANSLVLSLASAAIAMVAGGAIALATHRPGGSHTLGSIVTSFSAVASNFAGAPLAFAFVASLGMFGMITRALRAVGLDIYAAGFKLYSLAGLTLVYSYFQIPLMIIVIAPAVKALRPDWAEAAANLGATPAQYVRFVALPVLMPSMLAAFVLLFGNALSGYATAYVLTSGNVVLLTTEIGNVLSGDVTSSPQTGAALAMAIVAVMALVFVASRLLMRRASRWQR